MLAFLSKNGTLVARACKDSETYLRNTLYSASFVERSFSSSSSSKKKLPAVVRDDDINTLFTVTYLIKSCGLTSEKAASASRSVILHNPDRPDSVIRFLRDHGCTKTHVSKIICARPKLLLANIQKTLLPKIEYFASIGITISDMGKFLSTSTDVLGCNLKNKLIPNLEFCRNVIGLNGEETIRVFKRLGWCLRGHQVENVALNVEALRKLGMPHSVVILIATARPGILWRKKDCFSETLKILLEMGYDPKKTSFMFALAAFLTLKDSTRERKMEVFKIWGWTNDEVHYAMIKYPICLTNSEKKITRVMDFFVNKVGWKPADVAKFPLIFCFSLRKRIIPRFSVYALLLSKDMLKKRLSVGRIINMSESCFLEQYVAKYECEFPELRSVYLGKIDFDELKARPIAL